MTDRSQWRKDRTDRIEQLYGLFQVEDATQSKADFKEMMKYPAFRRILVSFYNRGEVDKSIRSTDTTATNREIGYREMGVQLKEAAINADFDAWLLALKERNDIERERAQRLEQVRNEIETKGTR